MKTQRIFIAIFLAICMVVNNVSPVYAVPPLPSSIYGTVKINGANAPAGTIVSAWINGVQYSQAAVVPNAGEMWFGLDVPGDDPAEAGIQGGVEGDTIAFKIGDLAAPQTGTWHSGTNARVDLTVSQGFPPVITEGQSVNVTMSEDGSPSAFGLTLNATDPNDDEITWSISTPAGNGTASAGGTGSSKAIGYTPDANYNGADSFVVQASDGTGADTITVNVTIDPVNDAPVANNQGVATLENTPKSITLVGSDVENDPLDYSIVASPAYGSLSGIAPNITYTPDTNYSGPDSFTFKVDDGTLDSNIATVSITVELVNVSPVCSTVSLATAEDTTGEVAPSCTDEDGDALTYSIMASPSHGAASVVFGMLRYVPVNNSNGSDTFTYRAYDGLAYSSPATVNVTVNPVNDAPVANAQSVTTDEDTSHAITLTGSDVEGSLLTYTVTVNPAHGTLTGSGVNRTYTPSANYHGPDSFTFKVNDGSLDSTPAVVSITVSAVNDVPVAVSDVYGTPEDAVLNVPAPGVLGNDTDVDGDTLTSVKVANPSDGTVTLNSNGSFTYTPNAFFNGTDSFTYKVNDSHVDGNTVTVTINVSSVNNAPVCSPVSLNTTEDTNGQANPSCTDADGNPLTYNIAGQPSHGSASVVAGKLVYVPSANYSGSDSFTYKANDSFVDSNVATVTVTVTAVNDAPVAVDDTFSATEDTVKTLPATGAGSPVANDTDVEGNTLTVTTVSNPVGGTVGLASGTITFTPTANLCGTGAGSFTYTVSDGNGGTDTGSVSLNITCVNDAPVAVADTFSATEDTVKTLPASGAGSPAANDTDVDGGTLTVAAVSSPVGGTVSLASDTITFTPNANLCGAGVGSFAYTVFDGGGGTDTGVVTLNIACVNDAPVAVDDTFAATEDTARTLPASGVGSPAANDTDIDGGALTVTAVSSPVGGTVGLVTNTITFTPAANLCGSGAGVFTYTVSDGNGGTDTGLVTLDIACANDAPVAVDDTFAGIEDTAKNLPASGAGSPAANDTDIDGDVLAVTAVSNPVGGTVNLVSDTITFTPTANSCGGAGSFSFQYTVSDGKGGTSVGDVSLTIACTNDAPVAVADVYATPEDTTLNISAPGVLVNDTDLDGNPITVVKVSDPSNGTLTLNANGSFSYVPVALFNGTDSFTYKAHDGTVDSNVVTVTINVNSINNAPVAVDDTFAATEDTVKTLPATGAGSPAANDTDVDGDVLTVSAVTSPIGGTVSLAGGTITFTPTANLCGNGAGSFAYTVSDGNGGTDTGVVNLNIACVNDVPVANPQSVSTNEDAAKPITLTGSDVEGTITFAIVSGPAHGTLSGTAPNVTYAPNANYSGPDSFTFKVNDGTVDSAPATVSITVTAVNDAPVANAQSVTTNEDTPLAITLTGSDIEGSGLSYTVTVNPLHGTLTGTEVSRTYTPDANYHGPDSFSFKVNDGTLDSVLAVVTLTVTAVNDAPMANAQSVTTNEDTARPITLTGSDVDGDALNFSVVTQPAHGTLSSTAPNLTYTPAANYNGPDSFTFKVNDGTVDSAPATVSITVTAVNDVPVANPQSATTNEDAPKAITLTGTDVDAGTTLTFSIVTAPAHGTLSGTAPTVTYTPAANYSGSDSFTFKVNDGTVDSASATVTITIDPVNDAPVAVGNVYATPEDTVLNIPAPGVLGNDTDVDGDSLTAIKVSNPSNGTLTLNANGSFTYTPNALFNGTDNFTYKANDGTLDSNTVTVTINVSSVNNPPVCSPVSLNTTEDTSVQADPSCTDADGNTLEYFIGAQPDHGTASVVAGKLVYVPSANFNGSDTFTYKANDGIVDSNVATVTVTVTAVNDVPVANPQSVTTNEDTAKPITLTGSDVESAITFSILTGPAHGTLSGTTPNISYTPAANYNGPDSFTFKVNDGTVDSATATVTITVTAVNDVPVANPQFVTTNEDTAKPITLTGSDVESTITFSIVSNPAHGTLNGTAPNLTYTPAANYSGPDSFTFKVNDGTVDSAPATVSITVTSVNDAPVAMGDAYTTPEDTTLNVAAPGLLVNDTDVDGNPLSAVKVSDPAHGTLTLNANGSFTYVPAALFNGADSFTYKANDGTVDSNVVTVTINVNSINNAPVAVDDTFAATEDTVKTLPATGVGSPAANDTDVDGDVLTVSAVTSPIGGSVNLAGGTITFTPTGNLCGAGAGSFAYTVSDGHGGVDSGLVTLNIACVNDVPVANPQSVTTDEDTAKSITLTGSDVESPITFAIVAGPAHGTLSGSGANRTYTPNANYNGSDSFTFRINDGTVNSNTATVTITVTAVNDAPVANAQSVMTNEDTAKAITLTGSDVESSVTFSIASGPAHGTLTGTAPNLTYTPAAHYFGPDSFTFKINDGSLDSNVATVSITVTPKEYTLTVSVVGNGSVTKDPDKATYHYGDEVQLSAAADAGWAFSNWSGGLSGNTNPATITISGNNSVTATFVVIPPTCHALTLGHIGQGSDPTASPASSTGCPNGQYVAGATVNLSNAVPASGWQVISWTGTGDDASTADSNTVIMPIGAHSVKVNYAQIPDTTITSQPAVLTNSSLASFSFTSNVSGVAFECKLDAGNYSACTSPKDYPGLDDGLHTFSVRAKNGALTDPSPASYGWTIDTVVPTVTIKQGASQSDPTSQLPIVFDVVFSELVNGFTNVDITVSGTASGTRTVAVTGSGALYTVSVSGVTGSGTVIVAIPASAAQDGAGNPSGASTSTDNTVTFNLQSKPGVPALLQPGSGALLTDYTPLFDWTDSNPAADDYRIQIATNMFFMSPVIDQTNLITSEFTPALDLTAGKLYYWRVQAVNAAGTSAWSAVRTFKTKLQNVILVSPVNGARVLTDRPTFDWQDVPGATSYVIQISKHKNFKGFKLISATVTTSEYTSRYELPDSRVLYWRVLVKGSYLTGNWSEVRSFKTGNPPSVPWLLSPGPNAYTMDLTPTFDWWNSAVPHRTKFSHYQIQIATDSSFTTLVVDTTTLYSMFTPLTDLPANTRLYWRVRAFNTIGTEQHFSGWSGVRYFHTSQPPAGPTSPGRYRTK